MPSKILSTARSAPRRNIIRSVPQHILEWCIEDLQKVQVNLTAILDTNPSLRSWMSVLLKGIYQSTCESRNKQQYNTRWITLRQCLSRECQWTIKGWVWSWTNV